MDVPALNLCDLLLATLSQQLYHGYADYGRASESVVMGDVRNFRTFVDVS